jgi:hypothetical protein
MISAQDQIRAHRTAAQTTLSDQAMQGLFSAE